MPQQPSPEGLMLRKKTPKRSYASMSDKQKHPPRPTPAPTPAPSRPVHTNDGWNKRDSGGGPNTISESRPVPRPPRGS